MHISYADDHITGVALKIKKKESPENVAQMIQTCALTCRSLLGISIESTGYGVNLKKLEVLLAKSLVSMSSWTAANIKAEMTWLGYTIKLSEQGHLILSDTRMIQKMAELRNKVSNVFQYVGSLAIRMKIFKTYISPIIEYFAPIMFFRPIHALSSANQLEVFQHQMLCWTLKVGRSAPRKDVNLIACETPVRLKCMKIASRLAELTPRTHAELNESTDTSAAMRLRGGKTTRASQWPNADPRDFGDRIFLLQQALQQTPAADIAPFDSSNKDV